MAARLAIARAQRQLADDAGVHLHTRNFSVSQIAYRTCTLLTYQIATTNLEHPLPSAQVINTVGAVSIRATLNCEAFANAHRASSHYDQSSFVGLAWRPEGEACCVGTLARTYTNTAMILTGASSACVCVQRSTARAVPSTSSTFLSFEAILYSY